MARAIFLELIMLFPLFQERAMDFLLEQLAVLSSMLFKLLEDSRSDDTEFKPTHFAVIFDSARKNFRNEIYSEYKANRAEAPEDLAPQFEYIRKSVEAFNLPSIEQINYEADDLIATYAKKIISLGAKVTIISSDKDLMQLVSSKRWVI